MRSAIYPTGLRAVRSALCFQQTGRSQREPRTSPKQTFNPVIRTDLQAHAQSLELWLMEIAVWLAKAIGFREGRIALYRHRIEARGNLRELISLIMCARMGFRKSDKRRRWMRPPSTPCGFRHRTDASTWCGSKRAALRSGASRRCAARSMI